MTRPSGCVVCASCHAMSDVSNMDSRMASQRFTSPRAGLRWTVLFATGF